MSDKEIRLLVWCMGDIGRMFAEFVLSYPAPNITIVGYTDSNKYVIGKERFYGYLVYNLDEIKSLNYNCIVIATENMKTFNEIEVYIKNFLNIDVPIFNCQQMVNKFRTQRIIHMYQNSEDTEIKNILNWLNTHDISVRNCSENTKRFIYKVYFDENRGEYPYVIFDGKRMYYPKDFAFEIEGGEKFLTNIVECDQYIGSPHLYIQGAHKINKGDVIVDAGTAEGNFTLSHIDTISKAYLIESDKRWLEALRMTFEPYKDKVVLVPKMLSDEETDSSITLDALIQNNRIDFIKMDIEGAETSALLGGINVLKDNNVKLSICSYHRKRDAEYIRFILESLGYIVNHTEGYMFFLFDKNIDKTLDFRRGVLYASK